MEANQASWGLQHQVAVEPVLQTRLPDKFALNLHRLTIQWQRVKMAQALSQIKRRQVGALDVWVEGIDAQK